KLNNLFDLFLDKIDDLKGVEIGNQIDKIIDLLLELQGYSNILEWKNTLRAVEDTLEEPFKEKIKEDLLRWKNGIINQTQINPIQSREESTYITEDSPQDITTQDTPASIFEEEYISPGLVQSQFGEEEILSDDKAEIADPREEMRDLFNKIQTKLGELTGMEISKLLQNIIDVILETEGYSMALKDVKDWISKLRMIRSPLEMEMKEEFELEFLKWKDKFS
ncbi:MAG: hypothetical protein ACFFDY_04650, partial [Candidatus Thorarchaeota archaeon]